MTFPYVYRVLPHRFPFDSLELFSCRPVCFYQASVQERSQ